MDYCRNQVTQDCEELLKRFQETGSVRFEIFSKIWREMKFSQIFYGTTKSESRVFAHLILNTACSFFLPPCSFQIRVGGLYLLYSLYHSQTASPAEHIRLALKDWEHVKKFETNAVEARHYDVIYILRQLISQKAFHFTAMPIMLHFKKKKRKERPALSGGFMERASRPQELINTDLLEELSNIHELYERMKTTVSPLPEEESPSSVSLIHKNLIPELRSTVMDFYKWQHRKDEDDGEGEDEDCGEGTSSQQECSQRAELLASIKSRAYREVTEASRSRRHRQVKLDDSSSKAGPSQSSANTRAVKPSLKARTNMNVHVSGDTWREAIATTKINRLTRVDFVPEEKTKSRKTFKWS